VPVGAFGLGIEEIIRVNLIEEDARGGPEKG
jgi:hypothetical protein